MPDPVLTDTVPNTRASLAQRILGRVNDGVPHQPPEIADLLLFRMDQPQVNTCEAYVPCVSLIVQGSKRIRLGDDTLYYGEDRYLITSMDLPAQSAVIQASPECPYLGVGLRIDWREIASLMLETPAPPKAATAQKSRAMTTGAVSGPMLEAFDRLLALLDEPEHIPALAPLIKREIHYRLMVSEAGARLRQIASFDTQSHQVARAIASLNARFAEPLRVETLAREAGMSLTTFHHHFKALTAMSPLQYQKQRRLTEARSIMLSECVDASTAAFRVGYESPSQFSREYRRLFGAPPSKDVSYFRGRQESVLA